MARDQRRLAAIISADVAGYSRLIGLRIDLSPVLELRSMHRPPPTLGPWTRLSDRGSKKRSNHVGP